MEFAVKFKTLLLCLTLLSLAASVLAASRSGNVTMNINLTGQPKDETVRLWLPYPVSDRYQDIGNIRIDGDFASSAVYTDKVHGTPILYAEWAPGAASRKLDLSFSVERQEILRGKLTDTEPGWNPADYAEYLTPTSLGPTGGAVRELADSIVKGKTTTLTKAKAIYDWTVENMYRDPETRGCGKGDV